MEFTIRHIPIKLLASTQALGGAVHRTPADGRKPFTVIRSGDFHPVTKSLNRKVKGSGNTWVIVARYSYR